MMSGIPMLNTQRFASVLIFSVLMFVMHTTLHARSIILDANENSITPADSASPNATDTTTKKDTCTRINSYRIGLGAGDFLASDITVGIVATYLYKYSVFSARYLLNSGAVQSKLPSENEQNIAIMYGEGARYSFVFYNVGVGIGYSVMKQRGKYLYSQPDGDYYEAVYSHTFGVALQIQIMFPVYKTFDIGVTIYGNAGFVSTPHGILFCLQAGDF